MEAVDSSMIIMDVKNNLDSVYIADAMETAKAEDISGDVIIENVTHPASKTITDRVDWLGVDTEDFADDAYLTESRSGDIDYILDLMDQSAEDENNECESDSDSPNGRTFLEAMTPDGQDYYLRLGDTPRQRSALRLSRIVARRQLLQRLEQGRHRENYGKSKVCS